MKKKIIAFLSVIMLFMPSYSLASDDNVVTFFVSPNGNDMASGSESDPLQTLEGARLKVRESGYAGKKKIDVIFTEGSYRFSETVSFSVKDSGTKEFPISYKAKDGDTVTFDGGVELKLQDATKVSAPEVLKRFNPEIADSVMEYDLEKYGFTTIPEQLRIDPYINNSYAPLRFYYNDEELTLARYPNGNDWVYTGKITDPGTYHDAGRGDFGGRGATFVYEDERIENYATYDDVWLYGRFCVDWAPNSTLITKVDKENNTIACTYNAAYAYKVGVPYYYFNVLEELDIPGEYYVDRKTKKLYFIPLDNSENPFMYVTFFDSEFINLSYTSYINFSGITMQGTRGNGILGDNCKAITIDNCTIRYIGCKAIEFSEGYEYIIEGNTIYECGTGAVYVTSGDRKYLKPSGTRVINNHIYNFSQWQKTYSAAVSLKGCYEVCANNEIHGGDHMAIAPDTGSVIEYNDIYDVLKTADDSGVVYNYMTATQADIHIRNNFFHSSAPRGIIVNTGNWAIYQDGFTSFNHIYNNIFYDMAGAIHINGGQFQDIHDNLIINCESGVYAHAFTSHGSNDFWKPIDVYGADKGLWKYRYPIVSKYRDNNAFTMFKGNMAYNNINCNVYRQTYGASMVSDIPNVYYNNINVDKDIFKDLENYDFSFVNPEKYEGICEEIDIKKVGIGKRSREEIEENLPEYCKYQY